MTYLFKKDGTATSISAFGEPVAVPITPVIQLDGLYGLQEKNFETFDAFGGTADTTNTLMRCQTGTNLYGYGVLRSRRAVRYRPGQGALARFTAAFTESAPGVGVSGYTQRAGFFTQEQALQIGFDGENFGILRQNEGKAHIETLTITTGATVASNVTVTLNNTAYPVPVSASSNLSITAAEISSWFKANQSAWTIEHCDGVVNFLSTSIGVKAGTFSFSGGTTNAVGSTSTIQAGNPDTNNWVYQSNFNIDKLDGTGPSGMTLDATKLNVYQINFRWLGAGELRFAIENPANGEMIFFHKISYANQNIDVHLDNPSLKIGYVAASLGGSGTNVTVTGASMMGAIEGQIKTTTLTTAANRLTEASFTADTLHHGLTVHNRLSFGGKINTRELFIREISLVATPATGQDHPVKVSLFYNFNGQLDPIVFKVINSTQSSAFYSDDTGTLTLGTNTPIYTFFITAPGYDTIDLENLRLVIPPNNDLTIAFESTATMDGIGIGVTFTED